MTLFAGATQVQKAYIGASAVNAIMHAGVNVLGVNGSFPGITDSELYLPLTNTLVPTRGASTPTFTRATEAWDFDSEGKLNLNIPDGCPRFTGARLVRNRIVNSDPSSASWTLNNCTVAQTTDPAGGSAAAVVTVTASATNSILPTSKYSFTGDNRASFYFKPGTAEWFRFLIYDGYGNQARFWFNALTQQIGTLSTGGTGWTAVSAAISNEGSGWFRLQALASITGNTYFQVSACDADNSTNYTTVSGKTITIAFPQSENVSGQADKTASEYVSVGVLAAPYHGAGVDGCKYFSTNKDGSAISPSVLKGYWAEPSRVNNCLHSRKVAEVLAFAVPKWYASTTGSELVTNGTFTTDTTGWLASGATATIAAVAGQLEVTCTGTGYGAADCTSVIFNGTKTLVVSATVSSFASIAFGDAVTYNKFGVYSSTDSGTQRLINVSGDLKIALLTNSNVASTKRTYDNISVKEAAIQVTTTTGLDNVANSASRLTAAANDATLLQLLTAATGSRTFSAWIKRVSGSGAISLTRNGGTDWTDITSSLVTGTWVPVALTSDVGANPTVGLKMGTSGDVIEVDCCQDENGAWRTSPILTTTAAVTRNADVLSYTHAGVLNDTQGAVRATVAVSKEKTSTTYAVAASPLTFFLQKGNSGTVLQVVDGTTSLIGAAWSNDGLPRNVVASWAGAVKKSCMSGGVVYSDPYDGSWNIVGLHIGCISDGSNQLSGNIGEVHIWTTPLTDAQMQQVTA